MRYPDNDVLGRIDYEGAFREGAPPAPQREACQERRQRRFGLPDSQALWPTQFHIFHSFRLPTLISRP